MDNKLLSRGVSEIIPAKAKLESLISGKKIRVYFGIDPTGTRLHLGHSIPLRKLQQFADAGHDAILLFGTGTVLAGDPSQRLQARKKISADEIEKNIATWKEQVKPIIDFDKVHIMQNAEWLLPLKLTDIINIASNISAIQLIKRDMFQKRLVRGNTVWTHEILYPLLQGYDSVVLDADLEIGGTDQTFNMLIGRELMQKMKNKEKYVLTTPMITGTDGEQMSKSTGNCIWLGDSADEMYGKLMSISDSQLEPYMSFLTDIPDSEIKKSARDPLNAKKLLAHTLVEMYHNKKEADDAQNSFATTFQKGKPKYDERLNKKETLLTTVAEVVGSKSEAKRLISAGGVDINQKTIKVFDFKPKIGDKIRIGKKTFAELV